MSAKRKKAKTRRRARLGANAAARKTQPKKATRKGRDQEMSWIDQMPPIDQLILSGQLELLLIDLRKQIANLPSPTRKKN